MKKKIFAIILCIGLLIGLTGCGKEKVPSYDELRHLQAQITDRLTAYSDYTNFASCSIDSENNKVVVELVDNSSESQKWFLEHVVDSKNITFKQGGPYSTSN